ncbi:MAG: DUF3307 domain-containing protein [Proteobacteria bacterium]|nr:DUF3307 domain-containing protein [Pseudomonadota bacterium]
MAYTAILNDQARLALTALAILQFKHWICDFVLQTAYQYRNKGIYGHVGGFLHAGIHSLGTLSAFLLIAPSWKIGAAIIATEFVVHYHIDWTKEQITRRKHWSLTDAGYWWTLGADQLLHQLTYIAIVATLMTKFG